MKRMWYLLSLVVFLFGFVGCVDSPVEPQNKGGDGVLGGEEKYPVEVPFEEYSLEGTSCSWTDYDASYPVTERLLIVNNNEELAKYIVCTGDSYPEIDFSKNTLLLAQGYTPSLVERLETKVMQNTANEYTIDITIHMLLVGQPGRWTEAVIVPKIDDGAKITLKAVFYDGK